MKTASSLCLLLALCLPATVLAGPAKESGVNADIRRDMADARREIRTELAKARAELETENLSLGDSLTFGGEHRRRKASEQTLPKAEITPQGDLLIAGQAVAVDAQQRSQLLAYRAHVIDIAQAGMDIGERTASAALDAVDRGLFSLIASAMTGSLERRIEKTVRETVEPGVLRICGRLPALLETQQQLAGSLPSFQPYATLESADVADCEREVRNQFASR